MVTWEGESGEDHVFFVDLAARVVLRGRQDLVVRVEE